MNLRVLEYVIAVAKRVQAAGAASRNHSAIRQRVPRSGQRWLDLVDLLSLPGAIGEAFGSQLEKRVRQVYVTPNEGLLNLDAGPLEKLMV